MIFDPIFLTFGIAAVIFAGISKGGFGSGASFAAGPILAMVVEPAVALGILMPLLMVMDGAALKAFWRQWSGRDVVRLSVGAVPGVAIGVWIWQAADADLLRILIGSIALFFVVYQATRRSGLLPVRPRPWHASVGYLTGLIGGFTSFVSHAGGPAFAVYLLSQGLSKTSYQATTVVVFGLINVLKIGPYASIGIMSKETLLASLVLAPAAYVGTRIGVRAHHWLSEEAFFRITYAVLLIAGGKLIFDALT